MHSGRLGAHDAHRHLLHVVGCHEVVAVADSALVDHGAIVRHLNRFPNAGLAALHYAQLVCGVVNTQMCQFFTWQPLPRITETQSSTVGASKDDRRCQLHLFAFYIGYVFDSCTYIIKYYLFRFSINLPYSSKLAELF